jgi:hypothetical protein
MGSPVAYGGKPSYSAGFTRFLRRETLPQNWLRNALAPFDFPKGVGFALKFVFFGYS